MTKKEVFNKIKSTIENIAQNIEITNNNFVVIVGCRGDYKYQRDYVEKILYCSYDQAETIVRKTEEECKDVLSNNRNLYLTYLYVPTAYTKSSLVSNAVYMPR